MLRFDILESLYKKGLRVFKGEIFKNDTHYSEQFGAGGEDYNPPQNVRSLCVKVNKNNAENVVVLYQDKVLKESGKGEKKIYSSDESGENILAYIYLKNDGNIKIKANANIEIEATANCTVNAENIELAGTGGQGVARIGDEVEVDITAGSSVGTYKGEITKGSSKVKSN